MNTPNNPTPTIVEALKPFADAAKGIPSTQSDPHPAARVVNDARAAGTVTGIPTSAFRDALTALARYEAAAGRQIVWTSELEAARVSLCEFWVRIADDAGEGGARYPELGRRALETEQALTILGDIALAQLPHPTASDALSEDDIRDLRIAVDQCHLDAVDEDDEGHVERLRALVDRLVAARPIPTASVESVARETGVTHDLKTWPSPFASIRAGLKPWELRRDDRNYQIGDVLRLREWSPDDETYTGETEDRRIIWMLQGGNFGLPHGYVIMSLALTAQQHPGEEGGGPTAPDEQQVHGSPQERPSEEAKQLLVYLKNHHHVTESAIGLALLAFSNGQPAKARAALERAVGMIEEGPQAHPYPPSVATEATGVVPAWQDIRRLLLNDWEGMKEQDFPESILRDWAPDAAEFIRRSPPLPVARATTPSAPIPTEDHEQGVRGSPEPGEPGTWWAPIGSAPRDGTHILIAFGPDGVMEGWWEDSDTDSRPWKFVDRGCPGSQFMAGEMLNGSRDSVYGPSHWMRLPWGPIPEATSPSPLRGSEERAGGEE